MTDCDMNPYSTYPQSLVSICVPTYNGSRYLEACLDSALAQTYSDSEILIVDDQSTDNSFSIAQDYATRDSRVRVIRNEKNLGLVGNWNQCVFLARGEWIKFLFQDDILEPDCIEKMLAVSRPGTSLIVCKRKFIFENDAGGLQENFSNYVQKYNMDRIFFGMTEISREDFCKAVLYNLLGNFVGEPTATMLRRSVFSRFGLFNPYLIQLCDLEYWIRVGSHTGLVYVPEILAHFRVHNQASSVVNQALQKFRRNVFDELICYHDFTFHPLYATLRSLALQQEPPINLKELFALKIKHVRKVARKTAKDPLHPDQGLLEEWHEMTSLFPGFKLIKKVPLSLTFAYYRWKVRSILKGR